MPVVNVRRNRVLRRIAGTVAASVLAAGAVVIGTHAGQSGTVATAGVADAAPGYAVEDFAYPQADKILAEKGLVLKRGDGHITLADCASGTGQLELLARNKGDKLCFDVVGNEGFLTMEIPAVYSVRGNDYSTTVDMTVGDEEKSFPITENTWTPVGESADPENRDFLLVEIRTSK
ncbi:MULTISPECIES: hypothetical protein [unclassified Streptomyces]|uniref:hypothetical protein n=1 Tax=Streptomyces sp. AM 3-1-1 TaxID=3028711 RepID=UPI0023BA1DF5|nr:MULTISPECIES: hypothetical protein [unclassified Streptomyces]MDT0420492.1 hypothetical protein [Streptomyces sp. DSM 41859]WEH29173.1 hypothetical protein P0D76_18650 [Streptomyces sp. AM 3-1-1]